MKHALLLPALAALTACTTLSGQNATLSAANIPTDTALVQIPVADALALDFQPLYPGNDEAPQLVVLNGDPKTGPSLTLFRYGRNYDGSGNLHAHQYAYRSWLIEGEMTHWDQDGDEASAPVLRPGSYLHQPGGELHAANCIAARCTAYVLFDGPIITTVPDAVE